MGDYYRIQLSALEGFDLAVARLDMTGQFTFLNPAARRLFGMGDERPLHIRDLFPTDSEYQRIRAQLLKRAEGVSSHYHTHFRRLGGTACEGDIPVSVYAFPDTSSDGGVTGSIVIVRDLREERARAAIHRAIEQHTHNAHLLAEVAAELGKLVEVDEVRVTAISKGRLHLRRMFSTDADARKKFPQHWWPMPAFLQRSLARRVTGILDIEKTRSDPDYAELIDKDEATRRFFSSGVRQVLSVPIRHDGIVVAFLSLDSRSEGRFTEETVALMDRLPLTDVVMTALHRTESNTQKSVLDLIHRLGTRATDARQVVDALVGCLGKTFEWKHVSMFQREASSSRLRLVSQSNHGHVALPEALSISCPDPSGLATGGSGGGPLCEALRTRALVHRQDGLGDGPFAGQPGASAHGSSLTVPVTGRKTEWVLYVESDVRGCFAREEEELLELIASEAASVLDKSALFELQRLVLGAINDAVIETNDDGSIRWSNEAAQQIFNLDGSQYKRMMIDELLDESTDFASLLRRERFSHEEVHLRVRDGRLAPGLLSGSRLPDHMGGRVYVASDVTFQRGTAQLDLLRMVFRHAALEGRNPLTLAAAWLQQCGDGKPMSRETMDKVSRQLARADLPLERLMRLAQPARPRGAMGAVDLGDALKVTLGELPDSMLDAIAVDGERPPLPVVADFNDLQFCIESMIAFGLRTRPQSMKLRVSSRSANGAAVVQVAGDWEAETGVDPDSKRDRWKRKTVCDLTLGEGVLEDIARRAGGKFCNMSGPGLAMSITLPLHGAGRAS